MDPDDLSELERRLSARRPSASGLDADAMLFAAGRAAGASRFPWPALAGLLAALALGLGCWATAERSERLALSRLALQPASPPPVTVPAVPSEPHGPADDWLSARRALEEGLEAWPPRAYDTTATPNPVPDAAVFTVGRRDVLLEP
jgi:hypothetical protein